MMFRSCLTIHFIRFCVVYLVLAAYIGMFLPLNVDAQEPTTVTVTSFSGQVMVSLQGQASKVAAVGDVLRAGDVITTLAGAEVVLTFTEGSELHLGEKTKIDIAALTRTSTGARQSNVKLLNGRVRAFLTPGHQEKGSAFTIETPNATAGVKFSRPVLDVSYDPATDTTTIDAYTVEVVVTNLRTMRIEQVLSGQRAVIRREELNILSGQSQKSFTTQKDSPQPEEMFEEPDSNQELPDETPLSEALDMEYSPTDIVEPDDEPLNTEALDQIRDGMQGATSTVPDSVGGGGAETSDNPDDLDNDDPNKDRQRRVITIHFE